MELSCYDIIWKTLNLRCNFVQLAHKLFKHTFNLSETIANTCSPSVVLCEIEDHQNEASHKKTFSGKQGIFRNFLKNSRK